MVVTTSVFEEFVDFLLEVGLTLQVYHLVGLHCCRDCLDSWFHLDHLWGLVA